MLAGIGLLCGAATFGPVVFRSWVLQHDLDGGGHTISNVAIDATSLLLDGAAVGGGGGDTVFTNDGSIIYPTLSRTVVVGTNTASAVKTNEALYLRSTQTGNQQSIVGAE